jgi:hypothetical protein
VRSKTGHAADFYQDAAGRIFLPSNHTKENQPRPTFSLLKPTTTAPAPTTTHAQPTPTSSAHLATRRLVAAHGPPTPLWQQTRESQYNNNNDDPPPPPTCCHQCQ